MPHWLLSAEGTAPTFTKLFPGTITAKLNRPGWAAPRAMEKYQRLETVNVMKWDHYGAGAALIQCGVAQMCQIGEKFVNWHLASGKINLWVIQYRTDRPPGSPFGR
ncbi:hypothetical protein D3C86_1951790 [compost metagenome]